MLLAIDVGNTQTVIGAYRESELVGHWRVSTDANKTGDELALYYQGFLVLKGMSFAEFDAVIISSVVPSATLALEEMTRDYWDFQPLIVGQNIEAGIKVLMDNPSEVRPDRMGTAVAAFQRFGGRALGVGFATGTA